MNQAIKAYAFIPSGFRNFIQYGFAGWRFVYFLFAIFCGILAYVSADSLKAGIYIFLQPIFILLILSVLTILNALLLNAREPLIKSARLIGLCLPPIGLSIYLLAEQSELAVFAVYPALLYVVGSIFLGSRPRVINALPALVMVILAGTAAYFYSTSTDKWFGQKLTFDKYHIHLARAAVFTGEESQVYKFLLTATPVIGHIPQVDEISDSLGIDRVAVRNALMKLDEMGRIVLGADSEIRYAYPWALFDNGFEVIIEKDNMAPCTVYAASALHALSVPLIVCDARIKVYGRIRDTGRIIEIEIAEGSIKSTNFPEVLVYKGDDISEMEFYSSLSGAKSTHRGRFDSTRLLTIDRAMIVAEEIIRKRAAGLL
jgi:hypothetical protein